jgi:hypothetical protein
MHRTRRLSVLALILLLGAALWLPGCDNPACVFGGNCFGGGVSGALGTGTASVPGDGEWVSVSAPTVERVAPTGSASVDSRTPLVVVFSESMASSGMQTLFLLHDSSGLPVAVVASLIGDGRVLVLLPVNELDAGATYSLDYNQNGSVEDRTGQVLAIPTDTQLTTITVLATNATFPKLVTTWPSGNAINQGGKGEVLAFFDRPLDELTLDSSSFHVQVDGADLVPPVEPTILTLAGGAATDARVVRWRNVDAGGAPLALGLNATVTVELSPTRASRTTRRRSARPSRPRSPPSRAMRSGSTRSAGRRTWPCRSCSKARSPATASASTSSAPNRTCRRIRA